MAFNQQPSGWTAMSIVPNPDLFARAHNTINAVSAGTPTAPVSTPLIAPATGAFSPVIPSAGYQKLQQSLFPTLAQQQLSTQQAAPSTAYAAAAKQIEQQPWTAKPAAQPAGFLNPTTGQPTNKPASTNGWVSPVSNAALPQI